MRRDSLSEDLRIEKELGRVADRRLRRKGNLRLARRRVADQIGLGVFLSTCI